MIYVHITLDDGSVVTIGPLASLRLDGASEAGELTGPDGAPVEYQTAGFGGRVVLLAGRQRAYAALAITSDPRPPAA